MDFLYQGAQVTKFWGPAFHGDASTVLSLSRPLTFDELKCFGTTPGTCAVFFGQLVFARSGSGATWRLAWRRYGSLCSTHPTTSPLG